MTLRDVRPYLGKRVDVLAASEHKEGMLLSCTATSLWLVEDDQDVLVSLASVATISAIG